MKKALPCQSHGTHSHGLPAVGSSPDKDDSTSQWYESEHKYGYNSRQSTLGKNQGDADLPSHFKPSKNYLDETLVYRSTLKRYIEPSAWSRAKGIAGKPVQDAKLTDLTHKGIQE